LRVREEALSRVEDGVIAAIHGRMQETRAEEEVVDHLKESVDRLRAEAEHDPLTGALNRRGLEDRLHAAAQIGDLGDTFAVMVVDVDGLKNVNDCYGHVAGDALLEAVASRLRQTLREGDAVARIGGDEFVILCPGVDRMAAPQLAEKLIAVVCKDPVAAGGQTIPVRVSVGWAVATSPDDARGILERADAAMYQAKRRWASA